MSLTLNLKGDVDKKECLRHFIHPFYHIFYPMDQWLSRMGSFSIL